jgi:DUF1680 family protein
LVASIGSYLYGVADDAIAVHIYGENTAELEVGGRRVTLTQESRYPWDGAIGITVGVDSPTRFTLHLRIPGWCPEARLAVNGQAVDIAAHMRDGYVAVAREWGSGDAVRLDLDMEPQRLYPNPNIQADLGRVALRRGPLLYCAESADNDVGVHSIKLPRTSQLEARFEPDFLGGAVTLTADVERDSDHNWNGTLYRADPPATVRAALKAVPYFAWGNRDAGDMLVWLRDAS